MLLLIISCASSNPNLIYNELHEDYFPDTSHNYFFGVGNGKASTEDTAMKIARATALGELSTSIKVHMQTKLELYQSERSDGESFESISQQIVEIGQATVRAPIVDKIDIYYDKKSKIYTVSILVKKMKIEYYRETAESLNLNESEALLKFLND